MVAKADLAFGGLAFISFRPGNREHSLAVRIEPLDLVPRHHERFVPEGSADQQVCDLRQPASVDNYDVFQFPDRLARTARLAADKVAEDIGRAGMARNRRHVSPRSSM